eukprot:TRINITY_DN35331_c0_g1_i1.p1 TRINITY_DN35331_c0_g1~~TRINITY_DN35331_c0_g1_i1.p1  ORF type:complete len:242 (-),score=45.57 TRINITY_DN35331_c0_g1_i1:70-795(-)
MPFLRLQNIFLATLLLNFVAACPAGHVCSSLDDEVSLVQRQARAVHPLARGTEFAIHPPGSSSNQFAEPQIPQTSLERNVELASSAAGMMASDATSLVARLQALDLAIHHGSVPASLAVRGISSLETAHQDKTQAPTTPPEASVDMSEPVATSTNGSNEHDVLPPGVSFGGRHPNHSSIFIVIGVLALLAACLGCFWVYSRPSRSTKPKLSSATTSAAGGGASNSLSEAQKGALENGWEYH